MSEPPTNGSRPPSPPEEPAGESVQPAHPRLNLRAMVARFPVTVALTAVTLGFFLLEFFLGGTMDIPIQMRLGATRGDLVFQDGELFRLLCAAFVHHSIVHYGLNWFAFLQLGALVELVYGSWRLLAVYLVCALVSSLCSSWLMAPIPGGSRGASGAIMGLAGLLLGATWTAGEPTKSWLRKLFGKRLLFAVLLTFALGLLPIVDGWGHFSGFMGGFVVCLFWRDPDRTPGRGVKGLAVLMTALTCASFVWMAVAGQPAADAYPLLQARYSRDHVHDAIGPFEGKLGVTVELRLMTMYSLYEEAGALHPEGCEALDEAFPKVDAPGPTLLNLMAWVLVTRADEGNRDPARARDLATDALARIANRETVEGRVMRSMILDTLAEALIQLGELEEALVRQRESVAIAEAEDTQVGGRMRTELRTRLGRILLLLQRPEEARLVLRRARAEAEPEHPDYALIGVLLRRLESE